MASAVRKFSRVLVYRGILSRYNSKSLPRQQKSNVHTTNSLLASIEISMPSLSPTMTEGTIVKWYKKEGDPINPGDILCDIQTDKAVVSLDTEEEGIMAKIMKEENSADIKVGTLIAIMVEEGEDWKNVEIPQVSEQSPDVTAPKETPKPVEQAGPTTQSTAPTPKSAWKILRQKKKKKEENSADIKVGTLIAIMVEEGEDWKNVEIPQVSDAPAPAETPKPAEQAVPTTQPSGQTMTTKTTTTLPADFSKSLHASGIGPSVRKLAEEFGVPLSEVTGTGPQGRMTKSDVVKYIKSKNLQRQTLSSDLPETAGDQTSVSSTTTQTLPYFDDEEEFIDIPNTGMRTTIAKRLTLSKTTIPHSYVTMDIKVNPVISLRKQLKAQDVKVSVNDFIIKAASLALKLVPQVNSTWSNDDVTLVNTDEVCVAVATESGLITPIVKNASGLQVDQISETVKDLATRARENKLQLHEFQGGNFTISNLGMFGITEFSAVINPPQTAIMAVGSSRLIIGEDGKPESLMSVTLSYDARAIDMLDASQFLESFKSLMESPQILASKSSAAQQGFM